MKILFIANGFPSHRWAGTETYTAGIARALLMQGHSVQILCCGEWDEGPKYWNGYRDEFFNELPVRRIDLNWQRSPDPFRHLYNNPVIAAYLSQYLQELAPDLVHVSSCETLSASVLEVVKAQRIPLVLSITDFWFLCPKINLLRSDDENCSGVTTPWDCISCLGRHAKFYRVSKQLLPERLAESLWVSAGKIPLLTRQHGFRGMLGNVADRKRYLRHTFSLPDTRLVASQFVKDIYRNNGFDDPVQLHPYGHELTWLGKYRGKLPLSTIRLGYIGQIVPSKGVHLLVEAAKRLAGRSGKTAEFFIYGDLHKHPEYGRDLEALAKGSDNIHFCGIYPHENSAEIFSNIHALVVPSLWYDFPLIIHEAFATQTPVIATNLGGMAESVSHDVNGLLFEQGNVDDLVGQLSRLLDEPGLLQKLTDGTPEVKSVEEEAAELEDVYFNLLKS